MWGTGHPGDVATLHAGFALGALLFASVKIEGMTLPELEPRISPEQAPTPPVESAVTRRGSPFGEKSSMNTRDQSGFLIDVLTRATIRIAFPAAVTRTCTRVSFQYPNAASAVGAAMRRLPVRWRY